MQNEQIFVGCIAYDRQSEGENGRDWDSEYVRELEKLGWQFAGGAANVYSLERPLANSECFERLSMIGWLLGDPAEIEKLGTASERDIDWSKIPYGVFIFLKDREPECAATP